MGQPIGDRPDVYLDSRCAFPYDSILMTGILTPAMERPSLFAAPNARAAYSRVGMAFSTL